MKTPLGKEVHLGPGHIVLDGDPAPPSKRGTAAVLFSAHVYSGQGHPISGSAELLYCICTVM